MMRKREGRVNYILIERKTKKLYKNRTELRKAISEYVEFLPAMLLRGIFFPLFFATVFLVESSFLLLIAEVAALVALCPCEA
jgi:hypothetical protein